MKTLSRPSHEGRGLKQYPGKRKRIIKRRPSHEGRGLKPVCLCVAQPGQESPFSRRARIETE